MHSLNPTGYPTDQLRELILDNQIAVEALPLSTVRALFAYEIDRTETDNCGEPTILDALLQRLDGTDVFDHAREVVPPERYDALVCQATAPQPMRRMPLLKKIILIAAAVILLSSLGVTVYASYLGPFEGFVDNIKDLFGIEVGEVITNGDKDLMVDNTVELYADFETLLQNHSFDILYPTDYATIGDKAIGLYRAGASYRIHAQFPHGVLYIYLDHPPYTEEDVIRDSPDAVTYDINGLTYYSIPNSEGKQYTLFYNDKVYAICVKNISDFETIASHIHAEP